ncbi:hypothetical protein ACNOYE_24740 [Nannocystaceae bacterium ST9]
MNCKRVSPLLSLLCAGLCFSFGSLGCADDTTGVDDEAGETTAASSTAGESEESTSDEGTSSSESATTSTDDANFIPSDGTDTTTDAPPGNLGDMCMSDADCAEDLFCNGVPQFGFAVCSECAGDSDCAGGNCTLTPNGYFECGDGSLGQMCETDEACGDGFYCAEVIDLAGLFNGNFCSTCKDDSMCMNGQLCAPMVEFTDLMNIGGQRSCVDPKTVPNDQVCDQNGNGDMACEGFCTVASLMGLIEIGVCGECETDADCMGGTCNPAQLGGGGFSGSTCG